MSSLPSTTSQKSVGKMEWFVRMVMGFECFSPFSDGAGIDADYLGDFVGIVAIENHFAALETLEFLQR